MCKRLLGISVILFLFVACSDTNGNRGIPIYISSLDSIVCDDLRNRLASRNPNNLMRATVEAIYSKRDETLLLVTEVYTTTEKSRSPKQLVCEAVVLLDVSETRSPKNPRGGNYRSKITAYYQMDKNGDWSFYYDRHRQLPRN